MSRFVQILAIATAINKVFVISIEVPMKYIHMTNGINFTRTREIKLRSKTFELQCKPEVNEEISFRWFFCVNVLFRVLFTFI